MRAGSCTVQQALTSEAAVIVKQAVILARRRGHAQVTPLHVANTMLSSSTGLLRTACLQSHSHPLQCKALELCFNVALNRLPASSSSPLISPHSHHPSLSNALVAAFKRAQAQQRRGSFENQQQPLLAVKVEIEQLIISILDDPSVSRVMREAGFSSTQVKINVEKAISVEIYRQIIPKESVSNLLSLGNVSNTTPKESTNLLLISLGNISSNVKPSSFDQVRSKDITNVVETMMNKRRGCTVIVGDCLDTTEAVLKGVKERVDKGDIPEDLSDLNFISLPLFSISILKREDVEHKMGELRSLVKNCAGSTRGVVLYLGDLKWVADFKASSCELDRNFYCPVKHTIMELGSLISGIGDSVRLWLMGIATFQTYQRCRIGQPSLETVWGLHPITIPAGSLGLTFNPESDSEIRAREGSCWQLHESGIEKDLNCRVNSSVKLQTGARSLVIPTTDNSTTTSPTSSLPSWLQQYKEESKRLINNDKDSVQVKELCNKWDSICNVVHKHHHETLTFDPISPSSSTSASSYDKHNRNLHKTRQFWIDDEPNLRMSFTDHRRPKFSYLFNSCPNSTVNSPPSSEDMDIEYFQRFKEVNGENLKTICNALEEKVPCQRDIIPDIASTILQCRSGMIRRKENIKHAKEKEDTWFLFEGVDIDGKEKIARELAKLVFGSQKNFVSIGLSSFSSTRMDSMEDIGTKRGRDESGCSCVKRLAEEIGIDPHRVFFVEDIDQVDYCSQLGIKRAMERGILVNSNGDEVFLSDAIVILSCESFKCRSRNSSPSVKENSDETEEKKVDRCEEESIPGISLDLNLSIEEKADDNMSIDDIGLLETFDGRVIFKLQAF